MAPRPAPVCFATATTASFVPGALVAVASFRRRHPHFAGDVAVIHDGLPRHLRDSLQAACGEVRALAPALEDLRLRRRLRVKGYDEMLTDMNARHFARLHPHDLAAFNRVFRAHQDTLAHFGYEPME